MINPMQYELERSYQATRLQEAQQRQLTTPIKTQPATPPFAWLTSLLSLRA